jgi:hypothetical protein
MFRTHLGRLNDMFAAFVAKTRQNGADVKILWLAALTVEKS